MWTVSTNSGDLGFRSNFWRGVAIWTSTVRERSILEKSFIEQPRKRRAGRPVLVILTILHCNLFICGFLRQRTTKCGGESSELIFKIVLEARRRDIQVLSQLPLRGITRFRNP